MKKKLLQSKNFTSIKRWISNNKNILGIECTCDDTGAAIVSTDRRIIAESKYNQWTFHKSHGSPKKKNELTSFAGGVIPNKARILHRKNLVLAVSDCIEKIDQGWESVDGIALSIKPGLEPCLWEGIDFTKLLLKKYRLPFVGIHHMESHALISRLFDDEIRFPFLTLLISGGHCIIALVKSENEFFRLGESIDTSPGLFIDKIARHLGLFELNENVSSGGALMEIFSKTGDPDRFPEITKMMRNYCSKNKNCDFTFAGFLTAYHRLIEKMVFKENDDIIVNGELKKILKKDNLANLCASLQNIIAIQLEDRLRRALIFLREIDVKIEHVIISGGVAANLFIKSKMAKVVEDFGLKLNVPTVKYCTDNGTMIAWNGCEKFISNSNQIFEPNKQNDSFFVNLKPTAKCDLGKDISYQVKLFDIKI